MPSIVDVAQYHSNNDPMQTTSTIFHVEPVGFGFNFETAQDNSYMSEEEAEALKAQCIEANAMAESQMFVQILSDAGINVVCSRGSRETPDAVFPNNWFSTHSSNEGHPYRLVLYPMTCLSRRSERTPERIHLIKAYCGVTDDNQVLDLSYFENEEKFLEGTGACVFDRVNKICYVGLSNRAHLDVAQVLCDHLQFKLIHFDTCDESGKPIFHTNVMLNVGNTFAMLCDECFSSFEDFEKVRMSLESTGHEVVPISLLQVRFFCGNALELRGEKADGTFKFIVAMSENAWHNLFDWQQQIISNHADSVVTIPVNTIERIGGGSVRCMIGQLFTK